MEWRKTRISTTRWDAGNEFRITQDVEAAGDQFRLEAFGNPDGEVEYFATLEQAKAAAKRLNELSLAREDNERLRRELDELRQANAFGRGDAADRQPLAAPADNGRGIPASGSNGNRLGLAPFAATRAATDRMIAAAVEASPELGSASDEDSEFTV